MTQNGLMSAVKSMIHSYGTQVAAAMQRLEEIADEIYHSSAAGKDGVAEPKSEPVPEEASPASEAAAEEGKVHPYTDNTSMRHPAGGATSN